jgi:hypothetical protein
MKSMTWGTLPPKEEFDAAFAAECPYGYHIVMGRSDGESCNGLKLGDGTWDADELWEAITEAVEHYGDDCLFDGAMDVVSAILDTLGFEWV